jgi:hypothetical protein
MSIVNHSIPSRIGWRRLVTLHKEQIRFFLLRRLNEKAKIAKKKYSRVKRTFIKFFKRIMNHRDDKKKQTSAENIAIFLEIEYSMSVARD